MNGSLVLINLAGAIALLLWSTRLVRTGVERLSGASLRHRLQRATGNRLTAVLSGMVGALMLQSSTAVAMLVTGFAALGSLTSNAGLAMMLGADIGSALVVQILSFDLSLFTPILVSVGVLLFLRQKSGTTHQVGRMLIGAGLILMSLNMIGEASQPLRDSTLLPVIISYMSEDPALTFLCAALLTWLIHSSVAAVLLFASFAASGLVPVNLVLVLILGANVGSALTAIALTRSESPEARRIPAGNLLVRLVLAVIVLVALSSGLPITDYLGTDTGWQAVNFHLAFNVLLVVLALPLLNGINHLMAALLPRRDMATDADGETIHTPSLLDPAALDTPRLALSCATREMVRMSEMVDQMFRQTVALFERSDPDAETRLEAMDDDVDKMYVAIKTYLGQINNDDLPEKDQMRRDELIGFSIKLEQSADIIVRNLLRHIEKKRKHHLMFSDDDWKELRIIQDRVLANMQLAITVFLTPERETARQLLTEKDAFRDLERTAYRQHLERLRQGAIDDIETSEVYLDAIRDLKQINSLLSSVAQPILEESGELLGTRLQAI
ncbi:Na/Pi cotransporter family protein [Coralliovum pocilloporae]|uniref:Na/Pi cotransporter family protein n=1 Tax=Coralliovum pocilloporae TaxID=3066369 RepID=UPI00330770A0